VLKDNTPGDPHTIHLRVLCSVHCACFHKHNLQHNRRRQSPTSTKPFVCAYLFLVCARHAPTFACLSYARAWHLPARALPMPAACAEFCLHVFAVLVFLAYCRRWYSAAERHCTGQSIQGSAHGPTQIPGRVGKSSGFILRVIRPQTLCLSVSCFYLHAPCSVLPQRALFCPGGGRTDHKRSRDTGGGGRQHVSVSMRGGGDLSEYILLKSADSSSLSKLCLHSLKWTEGITCWMSRLHIRV